VLTKPLAAHTFYATLETLKETTREGDPVLEPIDAEALFDRVGGRMHILSKMVDLFIEELPGQLDALQQAIYKQNSEDLQRTAHALKGTVANFEAESACEIARKLEDMGHRRSHTGTRKLYHQLEKDLNLVKNALQNLITRA
jgi:HPt (histidine-containing phosphotransfer) domain-containing protein